MAVLDKDRPRGLRVPSLASIKAFNKQKSSSDAPQLKDPIPQIQLPAPSQLSSQLDAFPVHFPTPLEKQLPPNPLPSPPPQPADAPVSRPVAINRQPPPPKLAPAHASPSAPVPTHAYAPVLGPGPGPGPAFSSRPPQPAAVNPAYPIRGNPYPPRQASASRPIPQPSHQRPIPKPVPSPATPVVAVQQRTPPSSEGEPEQRLSNGTTDSLEDFIPDPEPEAEPELDGTSSTPNEPVSSEDDDRPWTPPEVEPVVVPLSKLHYSCYQDHRTMPVATNVWYSLPCMTCQKFDREIRYRCIFCCLRVCGDCYQALQKCPRRSLTQLMETLAANNEAVSSDPSEEA